MSTNALDGIEELQRGLLSTREIAGARRVERAKSARRGARRKVARATVVGFVVFALASAGMYGIFFSSLDQLLPVLTAGTLAGAGAVVVLALAFSLVYGSFANYLLELLGIRELK